MSSHSADTDLPHLVSLGMLVLDTIHIPGRSPIVDVLGGSGVYCTLGARLFLSPPSAHAVGWLLRAGADLPSSVETYLRSLDMTLVLHMEARRCCTRGELRYVDDTFGPKTFAYLTPPLVARPEHLERTSLLAATAFHFLCHPSDIFAHVPALLEIRRREGINARPVIIWEPAPLSCESENLPLCLQAAHLVDVFSPNHLELGRLFGLAPDAEPSASATDGLAMKCVASGIGPGGSGAVVVRAGSGGCCVARKDFETPRWLPAYYGCEEERGRVVDATGAGNAFLGGYAVGFAETRDVLQAACYGTVAASFAVEQIGMPVRSAVVEGERWNGEIVRLRLERFRRRLELE